jgi:hypothetical protein
MALWQIEVKGGRLSRCHADLGANIESPIYALMAKASLPPYDTPTQLLQPTATGAHADHRRQADRL